MTKIDLDQVSVTGWDKQYWFVAGFAPILLALAVVPLIVVRDAPPGFTLFVRSMSVLIMLCALVMMIAFVHGYRALVLVDDRLRARAQLRTRWLALSELTGVGLAFLYVGGRGGSPAGWYLTLWGRDGTARAVSNCVHTVPWTPTQYRTAGAQPSQSSEELAATEQGRLARRIYDLATQAQGPAGPLATVRAQRFEAPGAWNRSLSTTACWSPDGEIVRVGEA